MHVWAHTADLAPANTRDDPEVVIRFILQRRKSRLSQLLKGQTGRMCYPLNQSTWGSEVEGHPRRGNITSAHWRATLFLSMEMREGWVVRVTVYCSTPEVLD